MGSGAAVAEKKSKQGEILTANAISSLTGYALITVQKWRDQAGMPLTVPECFLWIIKRKRAEVAKLKRKKKSNFADKKLRQEVALLELKWKKEAGRVVLRDAVAREWLRKSTEARQQIETIPELGALCAPEGELREFLRKELQKVVDNALAGLAKKVRRAVD